MHAERDRMHRQQRLLLPELQRWNVQQRHVGRGTSRSLVGGARPDVRLR